MLSHRSTGRRGGVLVYTAVVMFVLIGFAGLAIDWGYMTWTAQKLQVGADAAALAGAQQIWWSHADARTAAINLASLNEAGGRGIALSTNDENNPTGDIVLGKYDLTAHTFTATLDRSQANAVEVVARRTNGSTGGPLPLFFGPIFGKRNADVWRYAIAVALGGPADASVIALNNKDPQSFYVAGNGYMDLGDGSAQVDSSSSSGAMFQGTSLTFVANEADMVGSWDERGNPKLNSVSLQDQQPSVADPYAGLAEPIPGTPMTPNQITDSPSEYWPGYYPNGLSIVDSGSNVLLHPGVYILENGNPKKPSPPAFNMAGGKLTAYGVMFFIKFGNVEWNGNAQMNLTPMTAAQSTQFTGTDAYAGIQFFQARDNTQQADFNGTSVYTGTSADVQGASGILYFPAAKILLDGTGDMYVDRIVADKIEDTGSGRKIVTRHYNGRQGGDPVYLIE